VERKKANITKKKKGQSERDEGGFSAGTNGALSIGKVKTTRGEEANGLLFREKIVSQSTE